MSPAPVPAHPHRLAFLGSPASAVQPLRALVASGFDIALVVTRADKRRGRGGGLVSTPVKAAAVELGIPVAHRVDEVLEADVDLGVVVAFGQLIRPHVLDQVPMVNLHFSLLPRWRGAAPVERAILAGDTESGVCLMQLEEGLDTGPVFACETVAVPARATASELRDRLVEVGARLLVSQLQQGLGTPTPQEGPSSYAAKLEPHELRVDWAQPAIDLDRRVRVGGAWTTFRGKRLKVLHAEPVAGTQPPGVLDGVRVGTGDGLLVLVTVQPEGRAPMTAVEWRNGARPEPGEVLGR